jgi:hypothetical protein
MNNQSSLLLVIATLAMPASAQPQPGASTVVTQTPGLVAFWDFKEEAGQPRVSTGTKEQHPLQEVGGPIARVEGGPFSGYSAEFNGKQYFKIPYSETGDLNIGGPDAQVSMFAVVRIVNLQQSRTIAGMWSEGKGANDDTGTRQYALLTAVSNRAITDGEMKKLHDAANVSALPEPPRTKASVSPSHGPSRPT